MQILVLVARAVERLRLYRILSAKGHEVVAPQPPEALEALEGPYELAIVQYVTGRDWIPMVRQRHADLPILALVSDPPQAVPEALEAGADDFHFGPIHAPVVCSRIPLTLELCKGRGGEPAPSLDAVLAEPENLDLLTREVGATLGIQLERNDVELEAVTLAAEILVSDPIRERSWRVRIGTGLEGQACLSSLVLGGLDDRSALTDCVRELANALGGAMKRIAHAEGHTLALGLPTDCAGELLQGPGVQWTAQGDGLTLRLAVQPEASATQVLQAGALRAGMVLRNEVRTPTGVLLVAAGMALTESTSERLIRMFGANTEFEVMR